MDKTIMIVEDNEMNMKLFNDLLQSQGYRTVQSTNGKSAKKLALTEQPDLILMDIQLPEISGIELTRDIKSEKKLKDIPIIALTAHAMKGDRERMLEEGCDDYIAKPISLDSFLEKVALNLKDQIADK